MGARRVRLGPLAVVLAIALAGCTAGMTPSRSTPPSGASSAAGTGLSAAPSPASSTSVQSLPTEHLPTENLPTENPTEDSSTGSLPSPTAAESTSTATSEGPVRSSSTPAPSDRTTRSTTASPATGGTPPTGPASSSPVAGSALPLPDSLTEASGVAVSTVLPDTYYVVDDASGTGEIVAVHSDGSLVARIRVAGMEASNAEALASAPCEPGDSENCLYVGDIGDHSGRDSVTVYRVTEPAGEPWFADSVAWTYTYADGPTNAEALLVAPDGDLLVISKPSTDDAGKIGPHRIYRGPPGGGTLEQVGSFVPPAPTMPLQSLVTGTVVTDAAYDGRRVLLLTYDQVIAYTAPRAGADPADFPGWPQTSLPVPRLEQPEGIASLPDGCGFVTVSEAAIATTGAIAVSACGD